MSMVGSMVDWSMVDRCWVVRSRFWVVDRCGFWVVNRCGCGMVDRCRCGFVDRCGSGFVRCGSGMRYGVMYGVRYGVSHGVGGSVVGSKDCMISMIVRVTYTMPGDFDK